MAIHAQDWSPILTNQKMNYKHSGSDAITNTFWITSKLWTNNDTTYFFNKAVKDDDNPNIILRDQLQFFTEYVKKHANGVFVFATPENYLIRSLANMGNVWMFNNGTEAEVTSITEEVVFGVQDSVKIISLSDGNELKLSKSFGLTKFPDFENGGYFELAGIQDTEFGEQVLDFWGIFNYEVGDILQRQYHYSFPGYTHSHVLKVLINSKEIINNEINYSVYSLTAGYDYWVGGDYNYYSNANYGELNYSYYGDPIANKFQNELLLLEDYPYCSPNGDDFLFARISTYLDENNLKVKHWGKHFNGDDGLYYETDPESDILNALPYVNCITEGPKGMTYTESLGITLMYNADDESEDYFYLMGYVKDGVTVGTVYPNSYFITGVEESKSIYSNKYIIYPNPAEDWLYIKPINSNNSETYNFELQNIIGQIIREESNIESSLYAIDISDFKAGVYFYQIEDKSGNIQQEKIIIK